MRLIHGYTCHWYAQATLAALFGQSQTMSYVYTYLGLLISMPDSQKVMIEMVWFDGEDFGNCSESLFKMGVESGKRGEGDGVRAKGRGNNFREPVFMVLKK